MCEGHGGPREENAELTNSKRVSGKVWGQTAAHEDLGLAHWEVERCNTEV